MTPTPVQRSIEGATALAAGTRYHLVGVYSNPGRIELFVNGVSVAKTTQPNANLFANTGTLRMFVGPTTGASTVVVIDEVAVYNVALSAAQVLAHYNTGLGPHRPAAHAERECRRGRGQPGDRSGWIGGGGDWSGHGDSNGFAGPHRHHGLRMREL